MTKARYDNVWHAASVIEFIGRKTNNKRHDVAKAIGESGVQWLIDFADVNHCLSFDQVSDEVINDYNIRQGKFNSVARCKYQVPSYLAIGAVYARLTTQIEANTEKYPEALYNILLSGISDKISDFNSAFFYMASNAIEQIYRAEYLGK